jgi:hypothetical protein
MPLFYFHLKVGDRREPDEIGLELPDADRAYLEAFAAAQEMWSELLAAGVDPTKRSFEIADPKGHVVLTLPFSEVLERTRRGPPRSPDSTKNRGTA